MTSLARDGSVDTHSIARGSEPLLMKRKVAVRKITVEFNDKSKSTSYGRGHRLTGYAC
jgi:hypothetical protein